MYLQGEDTAPTMHPGRHPAAVSKMAADSLQLKRTKSWASKRRSPACAAHSRFGPAGRHLHALPAPASLPWLPSCCALGIRAVFVPQRQMAVPGAVPLGGGAWPPPAKEPLNEKRPRYPWQRPSLRVACPELHISDCKLLLTASLPSLRLTS